MTTNCADCRHLHESTAKTRPPWRWLCTRHKDMPWGKHVNEDGEWPPGFDPYLLCTRVNGGACPLFESRKEKI